MITIILRTLKNRRNIILAYSIIGILMLWMYVALFPSILEQSAKIQSLMSAYPESLIKAFNIDATVFTQLEGFLAMEKYNIIWVILSTALLVGCGGSMIAGEIEKGTIETLLSQPISRIKIFVAKYISGVVALLILILTTIPAAIIFANLYNIEHISQNYWTLSLVAFLFGASIFSIAMFFSSIFSEKGKPYFLTTGIILIMYVLNIVSKIKDNLSDLKYISFFHYYDPTLTLVDNKIDSLSFWVFGGTIIIFTTLALIIFRKRDISV